MKALKPRAFILVMDLSRQSPLDFAAAIAHLKIMTRIAAATFAYFYYVTDISAAA